jgi:hypothetical protein
MEIFESYSVRLKIRYFVYRSGCIEAACAAPKGFCQFKYGLYAVKTKVGKIWRRFVMEMSGTNNQGKHSPSHFSGEV